MKNVLTSGQCDVAKDVSNEDVQFVIDELVRLNIGVNIIETIWLNIDYVLRHKIVPTFWEHFSTSQNDTENGFDQFQLSIYELHKEFKNMERVLNSIKPLKDRCNVDVVDAPDHDLAVFRSMLKTAILSQLPTNFTKIVHSFYHISFNVFANRQDTGKAKRNIFAIVRCITAAIFMRPSMHIQIQIPT